MLWFAGVPKNICVGNLITNATVLRGGVSREVTRPFRHVVTQEEGPHWTQLHGAGAPQPPELPATAFLGIINDPSLAFCIAAQNELRHAVSCCVQFVFICFITRLSVSSLFVFNGLWILSHIQEAFLRPQIQSYYSLLFGLIFYIQFLII